MAFETFSRGWIWFVDGLAEALVRATDGLRRSAVTSIDLADAEGRVTGRDGTALGRLAGDGAGQVWLEPRALARRLAGGRIDLRVPSGWLFRRELDPVAVASAPFLDAFVRHQIDRLTPWRVADVHYAIRQSPLPGDPTRLAVEIGVVPRRLVGPSLDLLAKLRPRALRLVTAETAAGPDGLRAGADGFVLPLGGGVDERRARLRRPVGAAVLGLAAALVAATGWASWSAADVRGEIEAQDQVIADRKSLLAAVARRERAGAEAEAALRRLRDGRARVVDLLEALSAALPDSAYLTDLDIGGGGVRVSGVSRAVPDLVPALERAGSFKDVAFSAATTRVEGGGGDRFHLDMKPAGAGPPASPAEGGAGPPASPPADPADAGEGAP